MTSRLDMICSSCKTEVTLGWVSSHDKAILKERLSCCDAPFFVDKYLGKPVELINKALKGEK